MRKDFTWATGHWQKDCWKRDMSLKISASCAGAAQNILDLRESPDGSSITGTRAGSSVEGAAHPWCRMKKERMMRCPECGLMEFPKICPAVIIGVTDGGRILMSKYAGREYKAYALLAGFAEIGEPIEDTVRREVMEEVGLQVKNITYYKSQPWLLSDTLLLGFFCELDGEDKIRLDEQELALAEWVERKDITVEPDDLSLTNEMMLAFKNETGYEKTNSAPRFYPLMDGSDLWFLSKTGGGICGYEPVGGEMDRAGLCAGL